MVDNGKLWIGQLKIGFTLSESLTKYFEQVLVNAHESETNGNGIMRAFLWFPCKNIKSAIMTKIPLKEMSFDLRAMDEFEFYCKLSCLHNLKYDLSKVILHVDIRLFKNGLINDNDRRIAMTNQLNQTDLHCTIFYRNTRAS